MYNLPVWLSVWLFIISVFVLLLFGLLNILPYLPISLRSRAQYYIRRFRNFLIRTRRRLRNRAQSLADEGLAADPFNPALYTLISRPYERPLVSSLKNEHRRRVMTSPELPASESPPNSEGETPATSDPSQSPKRVRLVEPSSRDIRSRKSPVLETSSTFKPHRRSGSSSSSSSGMSVSSKALHPSRTSSMSRSSSPYAPTRVSSLASVGIVSSSAPSNSHGRSSRSSNSPPPIVTELNSETTAESATSSSDDWYDSLTPTPIEAPHTSYTALTTSNTTSPELNSYFALEEALRKHSNTSFADENDIVDHEMERDDDPYVLRRVNANSTKAVKSPTASPSSGQQPLSPAAKIGT